jgi:hypothetical protein
MDEAGSHAPTHTRRRRVVIALAAAAAVTLALSGGAALLHQRGSGPAVWRQDDGTVAIDGSQLRPVYDGRYVTLNELQHLTAMGKATASVNNRELACQGISLYFDTWDEVERYSRDFAARDKRYSAAHPGQDASGDPCAPYADAPRQVTSTHD